MPVPSLAANGLTQVGLLVFTGRPTADYMRHNVKFTMGNPSFSTRATDQNLPSHSKSWSGTLLVWFSQLSLYVKTETRLSHPLPEYMVFSVRRQAASHICICINFYL